MVEPIHCPHKPRNQLPPTPSVGIHEIKTFDLYLQVVILHVNKNLTAGFEQEIEQELPLREFR
jgi:hypothetical protein